MAPTNPTALSIPTGLASFHIENETVPPPPGRSATISPPIYNTVPEINGTEDPKQNPQSNSWPVSWTETMELYDFARNIGHRYTPDQTLTMILYLNTAAGKNLFSRVRPLAGAFTSEKFGRYAEVGWAALLDYCAKADPELVFKYNEGPVPGIHQDLLFLLYRSRLNRPGEKVMKDRTPLTKLGSNDLLDLLKAPKPPLPTSEVWWHNLREHCKLGSKSITRSSSPASSTPPTARKIPIYEHWTKPMLLIETLVSKLDIEAIMDIMWLPIKVEHLFTAHMGGTELDIDDAEVYQHPVMTILFVLFPATRVYLKKDMKLRRENQSLKYVLEVYLNDTYEDLDDNVRADLDEVAKGWGCDWKSPGKK